MQTVRGGLCSQGRDQPGWHRPPGAAVPTWTPDDESVWPSTQSVQGAKMSHAKAQARELGLRGYVSVVYLEQ